MPVRATLNGVVIAESEDTVVVEGNHYFPAGDVDRSRLEESDHHSICPWKGRASYYDVSAGGARAERAAWTYPHPLPPARRVRNRIAFWRGVDVAELPGG